MVEKLILWRWPAYMITCVSLAMCLWLDSELHRFPPQAVVYANWEIVDAHRKWRKAFEQIADTRSMHKCEAWFKEADDLQEIWAYLVIAHCDSHPLRFRLHYLGELKRVLGDDYFVGHLPPPVPFWRFCEIGLNQ